MGCYNNIGITVIIVIHVIHFKGLQDNSITVIGEKIKTQYGNSQTNVMFWTVYGDPSWFEGHFNCSRCFFLHYSAIHVYKQGSLHRGMYLFMAFAMGVEKKQEQNTKEISK